MKRYKKISIKRIIKLINRLLLLGLSLASLIYILYIVLVSMMTYLSNRPIKTAVLCGAFGVIMMILDEIEDNKKKQKKRQVIR